MKITEEELIEELEFIKNNALEVINILKKENANIYCYAYGWEKAVVSTCDNILYKIRNGIEED